MIDYGRQKSTVSHLESQKLQKNVQIVSQDLLGMSLILSDMTKMSISNYKQHQINHCRNRWKPLRKHLISFYLMLNDRKG